MASSGPDRQVIAVANTTAHAHTDTCRRRAAIERERDWKRTYKIYPSRSHSSMVLLQGRRALQLASLARRYDYVRASSTIILTRSEANLATFSSLWLYTRVESYSDSHKSKPFS